MLHWAKRAFQRASIPRQYPTSGFQLLDSVAKVAEENLPWYKNERFYPVRLGEVFRDRYQVLGKLGFGGSSTVWLCRDLLKHRYAALKVYVLDYPGATREKDAYQHLDRIFLTRHPGGRLVRDCYDTFTLNGANDGIHQCFILEALAVNAMDTRNFGVEVPTIALRAFAGYVLQVLDFLHTEAKMVHADLQPDNFLFRVSEDSIFKHFEEEEFRNPSSRKVDLEANRTIYEIRGLRRPPKLEYPVICDLGEARFGQESYSDDIQPFAYRAPEVILQIPWSYGVDVWNAGLVFWHIFEGTSLFNGIDADGDENVVNYLAELVAVLGPPPATLMNRVTNQHIFDDLFDKDGTWKGAVDIPVMSLESSETRLKGKEKEEFLNFMRKMLQWDPEKRPTARELFKDPWLNAEKTKRYS